MNQPTSKELAALEAQGYDASEFVGRYGIEREWEAFLHGKKGVERYISNAKGERVEDSEKESLIQGPRFVPPVAGHDVVLSLDVEVQKLAEQAVRTHAAAAVAVVEVDTGRIRALVSTPSFDPNVMTGHLTRVEHERMQADPRRPYVDKTLQQHYPPGSTYKFVTAAAALEDGLVSPYERMTCGGAHQVGRRTFRCLSSHGVIDLASALQHSCNIYFWKLSERVGIDRMAEVARDFGFGAPSGLAMNGDVPGRVPGRRFYDKRGFQIGHTLNAATGQGDVEVTVLQMAMAYAALANGGRLYAPQLVEKVVAASGEVVASYEPFLRRRVAVSAGNLDLLRQGMWRVVNAPGGTAYAHARSDVVEIAGKTGSAQVRSRRGAGSESTKGWDPDRSHAWFAGWAPAHDPEVAIVVLVEHGGSGGQAAGPVAREILDGYFSLAPPGSPRTPAPGSRRNLTTGEAQP
jgi:penicillin-binding protein 2